MGRARVAGRLRHRARRDHHRRQRRRAGRGLQRPDRRRAGRRQQRDDARRAAPRRVPVRGGRLGRAAREHRHDHGVRQHGSAHVQRVERGPRAGRADDRARQLQRRAGRRDLVSAGAREQAPRGGQLAGEPRHRRDVQQRDRDDLPVPESLVLRPRRQPGRRQDRLRRRRPPRDRSRPRLPHLRRRDERPAPERPERHLHAEPRGPRRVAGGVVRHDRRAACRVREG